MTKISRTSSTGAPRKTGSASGAGKSASGDFKVDRTSQSSAGVANSDPVSSAAPTQTLSALIALQSEGGGKAKAIAATQRALHLLDRVREGLLTGRIPVSDLENLANAAGAKSAAFGEVDPRLADIYGDVALRARVELAKLGR